MSVGDTLFMVAVVAVAALVTVLKGKVPAWLGFSLMLAGCVIVIIGSAATQSYKALPLGVAGLIGTILVWVNGATSSAATNPDLPDDGTSTRRDDPDTLGGLTSRVRWWAWVVVTALVIGAFGLSFAIPEGAGSAPAAQHNRHS